MSILSRSCLFLALSLILTSCINLGPNYEGTPNMEIPDNWNNNSTYNYEINKSHNTVWWEELNDPTLTKLIKEASTNNLDLQTAFEKINEAESLYGISSADKYPNLNFGTSVNRHENSQSATGFPTSVENYEAIMISSSWELDLFNRIKKQNDIAKNNIKHTQEDYRDFTIILNSNVALTYVNIRALQQRLILAQKNIEALENSLKLIQAKYDASLISKAEVLQAEQSLAEAEADTTQLKSALKKSYNTLSVLLGKMPGNLPAEVISPREIARIPEHILIKMPRDIIRQRPDIRKAEINLMSQTDKVGIAKTYLYPNLSLTGDFGFSEGADKLFSPVSRTWSFGPSLTWNIFNANKTNNLIKSENSKLKQARLQYESTVLSAMGEVENSLVAYNEELQRLSFLESSADLAKGTLNLVESQYQAGLIDFKKVLDARRALLAREDEIIDSKRALVSDVIKIYQVMGGNWDSSVNNTNLERE